MPAITELKCFNKTLHDCCAAFILERWLGPDFDRASAALAVDTHEAAPIGSAFRIDSQKTTVVVPAWARDVNPYVLRPPCYFSKLC